MKKQLIVITGASSGIGAAIAKAFGDLGHPLLLIARRADKLQAVKLANTMCAAIDIRDRKAVQQAIDEAVLQYGPVGCLVNNAGIMMLSMFGKQSPHEWEEMIQTNVLGVLNGMHAVVNSMKERKNGTIINISSIAGHKLIPSASAYCASKYATNALSETIRSELAEHNVRVITVSPGGVKTDLHTHMEDKEVMQYYQTEIDKVHLLTPDELASMVVYSYQLPQHICLRQIVIAPTDQVI